MCLGDCYIHQLVVAVCTLNTIELNDYHNSVFDHYNFITFLLDICYSLLHKGC